MPKHIRKRYIPEQMVEKYWYTKIGAPLGGRATCKKYGGIPFNKSTRLQKWNEWWEEKGKYTCSINKPEDISLTKNKRLLAEMVGILLGDGGITRYQITVTLHKKDDNAYSEYVADLFKKVFGTPVHRVYRDNVINLVLSRKKAVEALIKIGMVTGNKVKQQIDVPEFIKKDPILKRYCLRGLFDTDGSVFIEKHKKNIAKYRYLRLNLTNCSLPLIKFAFHTLNSNGIRARIRRDGKAVQVENIDEICKYIQVFGFSNIKHSSKIRLFMEECVRG